MSFNKQKQPEQLHINGSLRLRKPRPDEYNVALPWYQDKELLKMSEGIEDHVYTLEDVNRMYNFLANEGELYFIEVKETIKATTSYVWKPIGDVTLLENNLPIAIGEKAYWGKGIGKKVLRRMIGRCIEIGMDYISVPEVMLHNTRSRALYESVGFKVLGSDDRVISYYIQL